MNNSEIVFRLRKKIFDEWRYRRLSWRDVKANYGFSKAWFYKYLKRYLDHGDDGLRDRPRKIVERRHELSWNEKIAVMDYIYDYPTHGPDRIRREMSLSKCTKTVWNYLLEEDLNTRRKRRLWAEAQGKSVLTEREKLCNASRLKGNHVDSKHPGELVSLDSFTVSVKSVGRIWQFTACDTYSSYGWAKVYIERTSDNAVDFLCNHILKNVPDLKIKRVLTDRGSEFYNWRCKPKVHHFTDQLNKLGVKHSLTKKAHPWTNGYAERLNQTIWQEFYLCRLTKEFSSIEELQKELDKFMTEYNFKRMHSGYKLKAGGFKFPGHAFYDIREKENLIVLKC